MLALFQMGQMVDIGRAAHAVFEWRAPGGLADSEGQDDDKDDACYA